VVLSNSRGPQTLKDLVEELGPHARAATPAEAAAAGDLVVVSIPQRDGRIPELYDGPLSSGEVLQRHLGTAHVVKVLNNIAYRHLASLARPASASAITRTPAQPR
jgi:hypothetical protein